MMQLLKRWLPDWSWQALRWLHGRLQQAAQICCGTLLAKRAIRADFRYDAQRFLRFCPDGQRKISQTSRRSLIIMDAHRLEKGLALKEPRAWFGLTNIEKLIENVRTYVREFGHDQTTSIAIEALRTYYRMHEERGLEDPALRRMIESIAASSNGCHGGAGGVVTVSRDEIVAGGRVDANRFFTSRHSIRHFSDEPVDPRLLETAIGIARWTPSVCNRQAWRVHAFTDEPRIQEILELQNGNRGFGHQVKALLVVSAELQCFVSSGERNQAWIDSGMFAMSLVLCLHSLGLGACCLNCSTTHTADLNLRKRIGLPESEVAAMIIAVGHLPETLRVARSARKPLRDVLIADWPISSPTQPNQESLDSALSDVRADRTRHRQPPRQVPTTTAAQES